jgi:hypothetical protein
MAEPAHGPEALIRHPGREYVVLFADDEAEFPYYVKGVYNDANGYQITGIYNGRDANGENVWDPPPVQGRIADHDADAVEVYEMPVPAPAPVPVPSKPRHGRRSGKRGTQRQRRRSARRSQKRRN